ncbi:conjugal transfer protein [Mediterraneibacter gnavus]|uniref:Conjugal transfer protein n=2 Tax=Clostridia TaxID=186801 RepID=A0A415SDK1_MEDGN|nr:conjugal transfer protein [[Clostridium] innocuum]RHM80922.1 conjugal transfer protein [Mediterraneibacter gnavus]
MHSSYVAVPIACDALNAQAVAVREYHYLTEQVMAKIFDKGIS